MNEEKIEFRFVGIQTMSKSLFPLPELKIVEGFNFDIKAGVRVQAIQSLVIMDVEVKIMDPENLYMYGYFNVWCLFSIISFEKVIRLNKDGLYDVPNALEQTIKPVSISTVRGVIHSNLSGTYLQNAIMPVVYMDDFKQELPKTKLEAPSISEEKVPTKKSKKERKVK